MEKIQLIIASQNVHKIREYKEMLKEFKHLDILSLLDFPDIIMEKETEDSFEKNAEKKAIYVAERLNSWVIADDSGLVVPALNGEPGVFSARYSGENATDKENRAKLLLKMQDLKDDKRNAYFVCSISIASTKGIEKTVTATCEGEIIEEERGGDGFGYDSLFRKESCNKTFAEYPSSTKNNISHRRKALALLKIDFETLMDKCVI